MLSKTPCDIPATASSPARKRQLTQTPVSSRMVAPHFTHLAGLLLAFGSESEGPPDLFIRVTRLQRRGLHTGAGSRLPLRQGRRLCARLHPAAEIGSAAACCAVVFSRQSQRLPTRSRVW